jgi:hypothetical protein
VSTSSRANHRIACSREFPHISLEGWSPEQKAGRSGLPNSAQRRAVVSCTHGTPAGLPWGMPGMAWVMDGAMQQAPQPLLQRMSRLCKVPSRRRRWAPKIEAPALGASFGAPFPCSILNDMT